jgi:SAM-dependent methyltransferase
MGLDINGTRFLLYAKTQGVCFAKTAMIGRLELLLDANSLRRNLTDFDYLVRMDEVEALLKENNGYAEPFLEMLGATEICSFDAADYENATYIHDFNLPIDESLKNRFTLVLDGGSLEHIFNFPIAIKNCMEMVKVGGHFLCTTPANNFLGHGFYQFSPDLFFRMFNAMNGFKLERMILYEESLRARWYEVTDPEAIKQRITLVNTRPTYLLIIANKVESVPIFATNPQQSDYATLWKVDDKRPESNSFKLKKRIYRLAPDPLKLFFGYMNNFWNICCRHNRKFFRRMHNKPQIKLLWVHVLQLNIDLEFTSTCEFIMYF